MALSEASAPRADHLSWSHGRTVDSRQRIQGEVPGPARRRRERESLVVTKRDKPVAKVVPVEKPPSLIGTVEYLVDDDELIKPLYEDWEPSLPE
jgi:hypothetical protein